MKGKIKHRLLAIALCIAMIVTSVNLTSLFKNDFNAVGVQSCLCAPTYVSIYGSYKLDYYGENDEYPVYKFSNTSINSNNYIVAYNAVKYQGKYYNLIIYPYAVTGGWIGIEKYDPDYENPSCVEIWSDSGYNALKMYVSSSSSINDAIEWSGIIGGNDLDTNEGWCYPSSFIETRKGSYVTKEPRYPNSNYNLYYGLSDVSSEYEMNNLGSVLGSMSISKNGTTIYHASLSGVRGSVLCFDEFIEYIEDSMYNLNVTTTTGVATTTGTGLYQQYTSATYSGTASTGYHLTKVVANGTTTNLSGTSHSGSIYMNGDKTVTYYAEGNSYTNTLSYNANGGSGVPSSQTASVTYPNTAKSFTISSTIPTRTGYTFKGWSTSSTATSASYSAGGSITVGSNNKTSNQSTTLYAVWQANSYTNTLNYNANGGSGAPSSQTGSVTYPNTSKSFTISSTVPSRTGYIFKGWSTSSTATSANYNAGGSITVGSSSNVGNQSTTLYAVWTVNNYTVTYIDRIKGTTTNLGSSTASKVYGSTVAGSDLGTDTSLHKYYTNYYYDSCTSATVGTSGATVYRYFVLGTSDYKVLHQQEQLDGSYKTVETENLNGIIGSSVTPAVKTYTGFTSPSTQTVTIAADGSTVVNYYYARNKYTVTYIDVVDSTSGTQLGSSTGDVYYGETATGATKGTNATDNYYYNGYYYSSCTTATVTTSGATVYRIFKLRTIDINGSVNWNDKSNAYSSRPNNVTIYLFRNGQQIDTYTGLTSSDNNSFSFKNLQKYDTSTGAAYVYTVSQSNVVSNNNPEDKYTTTVDTTGFNFTNTLDNSTKEDPELEWVGFEVSGSIIWDDYDDKLGTRPSKITLTLYQNGVAIKTQVVDKTTTGYSFVNLDKYDDDLNPYIYKVEETFTARALTWDSTTKQYEEIDAYTITVDGFDFTNTLVNTKDKPIIEVKPEHINTLTIKLGFNSSIDWMDIEKTSSDVQAFVALKQMEMLMDNGTVSYASNYNGMEYNAIVTETGVSINNIPSGKYEIVESNDNTFILEGIDLQTTSSISVVNENGKWLYYATPKCNKVQCKSVTP